MYIHDWRCNEDAERSCKFLNSDAPTTGCQPNFAPASHDARCSHQVAASEDGAVGGDFVGSGFQATSSGLRAAGTSPEGIVAPAGSSSDHGVRQDDCGMQTHGAQSATEEQRLAVDEQRASSDT